MLLWSNSSVESRLKSSHLPFDYEKTYVIIRMAWVPVVVVVVVVLFDDGGGDAGGASRDDGVEGSGVEERKLKTSNLILQLGLNTLPPSFPSQHCGKS